MTLKRITVFCGSAPGTNPAYMQAADQLGKVLARRSLVLVYGGGNVGMMGQIAKSMEAAGGEVIGVIPRGLVQREVALTSLADLRVVENMHERKALMADLADGFIALPGGFGTLDEFFEVLTLVQTQRIPRIPLILFGSDYWNGLLKWVRGTVEKRNYISPGDLDLVNLVDDPAEAVRIILDYMQRVGPPESTPRTLG